VSRYFRRTTPGTRENVGAGLAAVGLAASVAAVTFYLVRLFLAREPLGPSTPPSLPGPQLRSLPEGETPASGETEDQG